MATKYFKVPFAVSGDQTAIPDAVDPGGAVSFTQGFGPDYEAEIGVDPDAKPVPRDETNYLYFEITNALKLLQEWGVSDFITTADNGGSPFSYGLGAMIRFAFAATPTVFQTYTSLEQANTTSPESDPTKWQVLGIPSAISFATGAEVTAGTVNNKAIAPDVAIAKFAYLTGAAFTGAVTGPSFTTPSDERLKDDIKPFEAPPCDLQLMQWVWNEKSQESLQGTVGVGVVAQHVQAIYPWCVSEGKDGILHVNHGLLAVTMLLAQKA